MAQVCVDLAISTKPTHEAPRQAVHILEGPLFQASTRRARSIPVGKHVGLEVDALGTITEAIHDAPVAVVQSVRFMTERIRVEVVGVRRTSGHPRRGRTRRSGASYCFRRCKQPTSPPLKPLLGALPARAAHRNGLPPQALKVLKQVGVWRRDHPGCTQGRENLLVRPAAKDLAPTMPHSVDRGFEVPRRGRVDLWHPGETQDAILDAVPGGGGADRRHELTRRAEEELPLQVEQNDAIAFVPQSHHLPRWPHRAADDSVANDHVADGRGYAALQQEQGHAQHEADADRPRRCKEHSRQHHAQGDGVLRGREPQSLPGQ
mmetsp:Transcript_58403/g.162802  ORF Transcript_58403/g.162802 Transcript_58403/m.162802 type:complete len:319 (-) Transcript_58403:1240-2196(-)